MDLFRADDLGALIEAPGDPHLSLLMPTHRAGPDTRQDPIRFKNLLHTARERLMEGGLRRPDAEELLDPAASLIDETGFWQQQGNGLAVFLTPEYRQLFRLPVELPELVVVTDRFHVKPLLPLLTDGRFYVLAISQNQTRLLEGSRQTVNELRLRDVPESVREMLVGHEPMHQLQFHTGTAGGRQGAGRPAIFHGHGAGDEHDKDLLKYFRRIDRGVRDVLGTGGPPLVLAGVEYLFPIFQEASDYPNVLDEGITGNPEELRAEELHERAWKIVEARLREEQDAAANRYAELAGTGRTAAGVDDVVPAAHHGRVGVLFVAVGKQRWGTYDPDDATVEVHSDNGPGAQDLLDLAAVQTLVTGGTVYPVEPGLVPGDDDLAAILRY